MHRLVTEAVARRLTIENLNGSSGIGVMLSMVSRQNCTTCVTILPSVSIASERTRKWRDDSRRCSKNTRATAEAHPIDDSLPGHIYVQDAPISRLTFAPSWN